jgi:FAD:protein FMN transferase
MKRTAALGVLVLTCAWLWNCSSKSLDGPAKSDARLIERAGLAMGSELKLTAWSADERVVQKLFDDVFARFERLDSMMSVWRQGSDILRLNEAAGEHPVSVSPEVLEALQIGQQVSEWTDGKFDVTFGVLSDLWRFDDQDKDNRVPDPDEVRRRLPLINYRALILNPAAGTAFLEHKGMRAHLGGVGKGYAVEQAVKIFRNGGLQNFMIQAGGDLYVGGTKDGKPWKLGINDPRGPGGSSFAMIELSNATFSTSGDYERFFMKDGVRYHHIIDPATGEPAKLCRSVTLVSPSPVLADAVSKGVFILGPQKGMALIERLPDIEGVIVSATNEVFVSKGLKDKLTILHPPTDAP